MAKKQSKKDERKRRLLFLILLFLLTVVIGGTATYAWFTSNRKVEVEPMNVQVNTVNGLQISADAINWKALVTKQELIDVGATSGGTYSGSSNQLPDVFGAVSTVGEASTSGSTAGTLKMFYGTVAAEEGTGIYKLSTTAAQEEVKCSGTTDGCSSKYYAAFDLFFKVEAATDVVLEKTSFVNNTTGQEDRGIQNASRVGFLYLGNNPDVTASGTIQASKAADTTNHPTIIWEPNCSSHTATGANNATTVYGLSAASVATDGSGTCGLNYYGVKAQITTPQVLNSTSATYFSQVTPGIKTAAGTRTSDDDIFTLQPGITKYRVYWWVEGQDVDAENNATGSYMTLKLVFAIKE